MSATARPVLTFISDVHLSQTPPIARSVERDWFAVMKRTLDQVSTIAAGTQLVIAGDVFHKWNSSAELINFAIANLPPVIAIPGQHDLPHHNADDIRRSAYWTLVAAETIRHLGEAIPIPVTLGKNIRKPTRLVPFHWGQKLCKNNGHETDIAVVHKYCWLPKAVYNEAEAPTSENAHAHQKKLKGFGHAFFGDNHKPFLMLGSHNLKTCLPMIVNCGGLFRRHADEVKHKPRVYQLDTQGNVRPIYLDCSEDKFLDPDTLKRLMTQTVMTDENLQSFIAGLESMDSANIDFYDAVLLFLRETDVGKDVRRIILTAMENA